jgi:hypothetical protein
MVDMRETASRLMETVATMLVATVDARRRPGERANEDAVHHYLSGPGMDGNRRWEG